MGNIQTHHGRTRIGVLEYGGDPDHGMGGHAPAHVYTHPHSAHMQIGLAIGTSGGKPNHRHYRYTLEYDDAYIRHSEVTDSIKDRIKLDPVLHQHLVRMPAEAELPAQGVFHVMGHLAPGHDPTRGGTVTIPAAAADNHDSVAATAVHRLEHKITLAFDNLLKLADIVKHANNAIELRHGQAMIQCQLLAQELVIDQGKQRPGVVTHDVITVTGIDAHHPGTIKSGEQAH